VTIGDYRVIPGDHYDTRIPADVGPQALCPPGQPQGLYPPPLFLLLVTRKALLLVSRKALILLPVTLGHYHPPVLNMALLSIPHMVILG